MTRLIDADALSEKLCETTIFIKDGEVFQRMINDAPSADAVEVVRCKDCKWYLQKQKNLPYNVTKRYCNRTCTLATKEDDYCSYGERRLSNGMDS